MDLKYIAAKNIARCRRECGLTQLQLAEKLNYSDKAVSKWESGASLPDVTVLWEMSKLFGVTVDELLSDEKKPKAAPAPRKKTVHMIITLLSVMLVWLIATAVFVFLTISGLEGRMWLSFIWAVPASCVVLLVFNSIWGKVRRNYIIISVLMWSLLCAVYLMLLSKNLWLLFVIGVPGEAIIFLWSGMSKEPPEK